MACASFPEAGWIRLTVPCRATWSARATHGLPPVPLARTPVTPGGYRTAAVREAEEEAGIDLSGAELTHFAHWLPPPIRPKRFSTHFFVCKAPADLNEIRVDGSEILDYAWVSPAAALERRAAGEIEFVTPTFVTLTWLTGFSRSADVLASVNGHKCFHTEIIQSPEADPGHIAVYVRRRRVSERGSGCPRFRAAAASWSAPAGAGKNTTATASLPADLSRLTPAAESRLLNPAGWCQLMAPRRRARSARAGDLMFLCGGRRVRRLVVPL